MVKERDMRFMALALGQARQALAEGEFPVGCVIAAPDKVVADGRRRRSAELLGGECEHAEMIALRRLEQACGKKVTPGDLTVYVTLEPCLMCFGAILIHGIRRIVYAYEDVMGGGTGCDPAGLPPLYNPPPEIVRGVMRGESVGLFKAFFENEGNLYLRDTLLCRHALGQS